MKIRRVSGADKPEWFRLRRALWPESSPADLKRELDAMLGSKRAAAFLGVGEKGRLVGLLEASLREYAKGCDSSPVGYIEAWYVAPSARRRGVGRALVEAAERWAMARGAREMASDSLLANAAGQAAHRALGHAEAERLVCFRKDIATNPSTARPRLARRAR
jgi:aminoglycoside 6'-N-acetyltransferase I